jgi:hypothetical protein
MKRLRFCLFAGERLPGTQGETIALERVADAATGGGGFYYSLVTRICSPGFPGIF